MSYIKALAILYCLLLPGLTSCEQSKNNRQHSSAELRLELKLENTESDQTQAVINFSVSPGWHIYSSVPQKNGRPTSVTIKADSVELKNLKWPTVTSFDEGISGQSEGYHGQFSVLSLPVKKPDQLEAVVSWVACQKICVPGEAKLVY